MIQPGIQLRPGQDAGGFGVNTNFGSSSQDMRNKAAESLQKQMDLDAQRDAQRMAQEQDQAKNKGAGLGVNAFGQGADNLANQAKAQGMGIQAEKSKEMSNTAKMNAAIGTGLGQAQQADATRQIGMQAQNLARNQNQVLSAKGQGLGVAKAQEPIKAPDFNKTARTQAEAMANQQLVGWQNQMDMMSQKAKEQGMKGTDLTNYLAHMELGNNLGLVNARQNILLQGLQKQDQFDANQFTQQQTWDRADKVQNIQNANALLEAAWGDPQAVATAIELGTALAGEDSIFGELKRNPALVSKLNDEGYNQLFQKRAEASSNVLQQIQDPQDVAELNATYQQYKNAKYGSEMDVNVPTSWSPSEEEITLYKEAFGEPNLEDVNTLKDIYAYSRYRKDVDKSFKNELATGLLAEFEVNGGNPEISDRLRNMGAETVLALAGGDAVANYNGGKYDISDPIHGQISHLFSDWSGNLYGSQQEWENRSQLDKNLDATYSSYLAQANAAGVEPLSRSEWANKFNEMWTESVTNGSTPAMEGYGEQNAKFFASKVLDKQKAAAKVADQSIPLSQQADTALGKGGQAPDTATLYKSLAGMPPQVLRTWLESADPEQLALANINPRQVNDMYWKGGLGGNNEEVQKWAKENGIKEGTVVTMSGVPYQVAGFVWAKDDDTYNPDHATELWGYKIKPDGTRGELVMIESHKDDGFDGVNKRGQLQPIGGV